MKYWNSAGKYQSEYERLFKLLVPQEGDAGTPHGELMRKVSQLYYDCYNNGNGNMDLPHMKRYNASLRASVPVLQHYADAEGVSDFAGRVCRWNTDRATADDYDLVCDVVIRYVSSQVPADGLPDDRREPDYTKS